MNNSFQFFYFFSTLLIKSLQVIDHPRKSLSRLDGFSVDVFRLKLKTYTVPLILF